MRAPVSVIIPVLNEEAGLARTLGALGEGLQAGIIRELVLSDGGSEDGTRVIAEAAGAVWVSGPAGRGGQVARGIAASGGEWLLVLHADTVLEAGWVEAVLRAVERGQSGYGWLRFAAEGFAPRFVAGWANLRSRVFGLPYGDQGLLVSRALLESAGGYPALPLMEDVALACALRGRLKALGFTARTSARKYEREGWSRRGFRNLSLLARYLCGADPERLAELYRRRC